MPNPDLEEDVNPPFHGTATRAERARAVLDVMGDEVVVPGAERFHGCAAGW
jgi:hypothetical protein